MGGTPPGPRRRRAAGRGPWSGLKPVVETITLDEMATDPTRALYLLRDVFAAPEEFRPRIEPAQITEKAARSFADQPR